MSLSRREFLQASAIAVAAGSIPLRANANGSQPKLPIPPLMESHRGQPLFLTMQQARWAFVDGNKAPVWGMNGLYLGPTVRVLNGDDVKLICSNRLPEAVSMTVSGLLEPSSLTGGAARIMQPNQDWSPILPVRQPAATCWYHANTPNHMASHVYNGLVGMWLVEDNLSKSLPLPNHYGVDDLPIIIQDKRLDNFGVPLYETPSQGGFYGDTLLVNGVQSPCVEVSRGWVRLRLLNASNARRYLLSLSDKRPFVVIATDLGFLPAPISVQHLSLAPGERREVLIDLTQGKELSITAGEAASIMDRLRGFFKPSTSLISTLVLTLQPSGLLPLVTDQVPAHLLPQQIIAGTAKQTRHIVLGDSQPGINGAVWNVNRIDTQATQGTWERWLIHADLPQSFHVQGVAFIVKSVNGSVPLAEDAGFKDTVWVDGDVELMVYFWQNTFEHFPFYYYSQTLELADQGSVGQLMIHAPT
jgi:suppressor of ftsI